MLTGGAAWANLQQDENGAYLIGSKADLFEWSQMEGYESTNVVLTADLQDIDFILCPDTDLGSIDSYNGPAYTGVFDGAGHTVTLNYDIPGQRAALFGGVNGTVKNMIVDGTIVATYKNCAGLAMWTTGTNARFENVISKVNILVDWTGNVSNAGFVGYANTTTWFVNCLSAMKASGNQNFNHGFVGWVTAGATMNYVNCVSIAEVETTNTFSWGNPQDRASHVNCYSYSQDNDPATPLKGVTYIENRDMLASGEMCYKLNGDQSNIGWYQTLGEDEYPVPFSTQKQVYAIGELRCDGVALGDVTYSNSNDAPTPQHQYQEGFCSVCGSMQQDYLTPNAEGFYELGTPGQVEWFSALVNDLHDVMANAVLTADIDYQGVVNAHRPIGLNTTYKYNGVFDGQGHSIKNMIIDKTDGFQAFFGFIRGGTVIRNLIIDSSCSVTGGAGSGGLVGGTQTNTDKPLLIENCVNGADVTAIKDRANSVYGSAGGIIGAGQSGYAAIQLVNCLNTGHITGAPATALCAWNNMGGSSITNCVNIGEITGADMGKENRYCTMIRVEPGTTTFTNMYDFSEFDDQGMGRQGIDGDWQTDDPLTNGELCYMLNGNQKTINWYQRIGTDESPVPYSIEGGTVYAQGQINCDGSIISLSGFSNSKGDVVPSHDYEEGFCLNCGASQDDYVPVEDGFYMISNASQLYWFSRQVNEFKHGDWSAKLTENINMEDYIDVFEPIGCDASQFHGTFDGQGHVISNLRITDDTRAYVGFIGRCSGGAVVENLLLDETCSLSGLKCVGLVGGTYNAGGSLTLRNLGNMGNVYSRGVQAAGILGGNTGSMTNILIENCFSTGAIAGGSESAAIVGWAGSNNPKISNCWSCSEVEGYQTSDDLYLARHTNGTVTNCYCTSELTQQGSHIEFDEIMTGSLCYKLNGDQTNIQWYQNIDNDGAIDDQPLPFSLGHARVYPKGGLLCDGSANPDNTEFSNTENNDIPDHQFEEGFCDVCGQEDPEYTGFLAVINNADFNTNASGWSGTGFSVANKIAYQSNKTFDTYQDIKGLEPGVYRLRVQGFTRSGNLENEEIYANGELTSDLLRNGFFYAESNGLRQARRLMDITADAQNYKFNDGNGEYELPTGKNIPTNATAASIYLSKGKYWNEPLYLAVTNDTLPLRIGFTNQFDNKDSWTVIDRLRIEYVGNDADAYELITKQTVEEAIDLDEVEGQETLKDEYKEAIEAAGDLSEVEEILAAADKASRLPNQIKLTAQAYQDFYAVVDDLYKQWESRDDLVGDAADILESYLTEENEPDETYPNGTYQYIKNNREIGIEELAAEAKFAQELFKNAVKGNVVPGADITSLIINPNFDDTTADWFGWETTTGYHESSWNMTYNSGYHDVKTVAGAYNTAFEVAQEITGLPNGIYELTAQAFQRPGAAKEGLFDGTDIIPAELFLNDYNTPVLSVYADPIDYADAFNGVNSRYDAKNDPSAPHNGENTDKQDIDIYTGYVPDDVYTGSFAFSAGRYTQKAYAVVTDGTLRLGIRNNDTPWRSKNVTVWADFRLKFAGTDATTIQELLEQYSERVERLEEQREIQEYFLSVSHLNNIRDMISTAQRSNDADEQMKLIQAMNDEFNEIKNSVELYKKLAEISQYAMDMSDRVEPGELQDQLMEVYSDLGDILFEGTLTDQEAQEKINELMENPIIGGTIYIQGDLYDEMSPNEEWPYAQMCTLYPMTKGEDGKWRGTVTLQDRSRRIKGYQRAGVFFRRVNTIYKCADPNRNFITPAETTFTMTDNGGGDFQALNGTYDVVIDFETNTVQFNQQDEYNWDNAVYVIGTLASRAGATIRWKNDEEVALQHMGNGFYQGVVTLAYDNSNPYCSFGIMACRSTNQMVNGSTATRDNGTTGRYGSEEQYLEINEGTQYTDLVRGLDRTWRIATPGKYIIEFDMNHRTMKATLVNTKGAGTEQNPFLIATAEDMLTMQDRLVKGKTTYFKLTEDIDMKGRLWWPLNSTYMLNSSEEGHERFINIDGQNHIIKNLTVVNYKDNAYETGFLGALNGTVKNLGLYNVQVEGGNTITAGLLAGRLGTETYVSSAGQTLTSSVENCYVTGKLDALGNAGAIAGTVGSNALISNCYTNANVVSNEGAGYAQGEMIGQNLGDLSIQYSYAAGKVNGSTVNALIGEAGNCKQENVLFYDGNNQETICNTVSQWAAWSENGEIASGWPILKWQVDRNNYAIFSGFGKAKMGDINGDTVVDGQDIVTLVNIVNGAETDDATRALADIDGDGTIDGTDIVKLVSIVNTGDVKNYIYFLNQLEW